MRPKILINSRLLLVRPMASARITLREKGARKASGRIHGAMAGTRESKTANVKHHFSLLIQPHAPFRKLYPFSRDDGICTTTLPPFSCSDMQRFSCRLVKTLGTSLTLASSWLRASARSSTAWNLAGASSPCRSFRLRCPHSHIVYTAINQNRRSVVTMNNCRSEKPHWYLCRPAVGNQGKSSARTRPKEGVGLGCSL